jgi:hypothetical protein
MRDRTDSTLSSSGVRHEPWVGGMQMLKFRRRLREEKMEGLLRSAVQPIQKTSIIH